MASPAVSDQRLADALGVYAGMVSRVLENPQRWLGLDEDPPPTASFPARALDAIRDRALGEQTPASATWQEVPRSRRVDWWVTRIGVSAGLAAAAPRFFGALADRLPVQASLGAAAAGMAVCATAYEHGRTSPQEWIPLLATVLFDRDLQPTQATIPNAADSERSLRTDQDAGQEPAASTAKKVGRGARQGAATVWQLAHAFREIQQLLDKRPRGGMLVRAVGKVPVIGVASGWLDERGGIRKAAKRTEKVLGD